MVNVPMRFETDPLLWVVRDVLSTAECKSKIAMIEAAQPGLATQNPLYRDQDRVMQDDPILAQSLFQRLKPSLPARMGELHLLKINERLRYYRYNIGQQFAPHMDHWYRPDDHQIPQQGMAAIFQHKIRHEGCMVQRGTKYALRTDVIYTQ